MEKRELTCIGCPLGWSITVTLENGEIKDVPDTPANAGMITREKKSQIRRALSQALSV